MDKYTHTSLIKCHGQSQLYVMSKLGQAGKFLRTRFVYRLRC